MLRRFSRKQWLLVGLAALVVAYLLFAGYGYVNRPTDLGAKLEYIGSRQYGCYGFCDSEPSTSYYFATNMSEDQLKGYFKSARYTASWPGGGNPDYYYNELEFITIKEKKFYVNYYHGAKPSQIDTGLKQTNKLYGIGIEDSSYRIAKSAL